MIQNIWMEYVKDWNAHSKEEIIAQIVCVFIILIFGIFAIKIIGQKSVNTLTIPNILFIFVLSSTLGALITKPFRIFIGLAVVITIVFFIFILEKLIVKLNLFERIFVPKQIVLYSNGSFHLKNISKAKMTIDQIESWIRIEGLPSVKACKTIIIEFGGNLSFEVLPEFEPVKKIYFDAAMQQILDAINGSLYQEAKLPEMDNLFDEAKGKPQKPFPKKLQ
jgi:uncharacterized membrane protein YcaP (DUF421 family)